MMLVWIVIAATVPNVEDGWAYLCRRYYAIFGMLLGREFEHSALCSDPLSPLCNLIQWLYITSPDRVAVRASGLGL